MGGKRPNMRTSSAELFYHKIFSFYSNEIFDSKYTGFFQKKLYKEKCEKWPRFWKYTEKKIRRMGISTQLGIEGKGDARAYKSNEIWIC